MVKLVDWTRLVLVPALALAAARGVDRPRRTHQSSSPRRASRACPPRPVGQPQPIEDLSHLGGSRPVAARRRTTGGPPKPSEPDGLRYHG